MRPSRRIPKALQRTVSDFSKRIARKDVKEHHRTGSWKAKRHKYLRYAGRLYRITVSRLWLWLGILFFSITFACLLFLFFSPTFKVSSIQVSRQDRRIDVEEIQKLLAPQFGRHIIFISPHLLAREISIAYPETSDVTVHRSYPGELQVSLSMDPIIADVYLGGPDDTEYSFPGLSESKEYSEDGKQYHVITKRGIFLSYHFSLPTDGKSRSKFNIVDWATKPEHRQQLLDIESLETIRSARGILEQSFGLSISAVTVYLRSREFHVQTINPSRPAGKERLVLWFDLASSLTSQINHYRTFLDVVSPENVEEYVDLRLHDRIVYR